MIWSGVIVVVERIRARLENRIPADEEFNGPAILNIYKFGFFTIMMATLITIPVVGNLLFLVGPFLRDGIAAGMIACTIIILSSTSNAVEQSSEITTRTCFKQNNPPD